MKLAQERELLVQMANRSRELAETVYDVNLVNRILMDEMKLSRECPSNHAPGSADTDRKLDRRAGVRRIG
jgi:hypothetical protein